MSITSVQELLPMAMVVGVGVSIYILLRTRWTDEPKKREGKKR